MAYKIKPNGNVSTNLVKVVSEQLERAIAELGESSFDPQTAPHQVRKRMKKVRAALRLAREEIGALYAYENLLFRDAGRKLADIRNAQAILQTFDKLTQTYPAHFKGGAYSVASEGLVKHRQQVVGDKTQVDQLMTDMVGSLEKANKRIKSWTLTAQQYDASGKEYRKIYRRGRRLFNGMQHESSPKNLHDLRKAVKYHWYHGRLLSKVCPSRMKNYNASVKDMADQLGEHHDMSMLRSMLLKHPERYGSYREITELLELLDRRQTELWLQAKSLGRLIYLEKPKQIEARMLADWDKCKADYEQGAE